MTDNLRIGSSRGVPVWSRVAALASAALLSVLLAASLYRLAVSWPHPVVIGSAILVGPACHEPVLLRSVLLSSTTPGQRWFMRNPAILLDLQKLDGWQITNKPFFRVGPFVFIWR